VPRSSGRQLHRQGAMNLSIVERDQKERGGDMRCSLRCVSGTLRPHLGSTPPHRWGSLGRPTATLRFFLVLGLFRRLPSFRRVRLCWRNSCTQVAVSSGTIASTHLPTTPAAAPTHDGSSRRWHCGVRCKQNCEHSVCLTVRIGKGLVFLPGGGVSNLRIDSLTDDRVRAVSSEKWVGQRV
jgi:hypothetical protein